MTNLKKIGLTALAGTLATTSFANAGSMNVGGVAQMVWDNNQTDSSSKAGKSADAFSMNTSLLFTGSGEMDNGWNVSVYQAITGGNFFSGDMAVDMGDMGELSMFKGTNRVGIASIQDKVPNAGEQPWDDNAATHGGPADGLADPHGSNDTLGYKVSANGFTASASADFGADGASTSVAVSVTAIEGLNIGAGLGEYQSAATTQDDLETYYVSYAMGPVSVGAQHTKVEAQTANTDVERDSYGITFAVNENFSIGYGVSDTEYEATAKTKDEENTGIQASYTTGGMTVGFVNNKKDNANGTTENQETTEIKLTFAF